MAVDPNLEPHWDSAALITIDMQRDFLSDGAYGLAGTSEILPNLIQLTESFRATGGPIVHIVRLYPGDGEDVDRVRRSLVLGGAHFVRPGSPGRLLAPGLAPTADLDDDALLRGEPQLLGPGEYALYKPRWGAFYRTRLDELLGGHSVDTLAFAGCNLPNCPRASIIQAHERDYRVALVTDAVSQASDQGFREIAGLGTVLCTTAEAVSARTTASAVGLRSTASAVGLRTTASAVGLRTTASAVGLRTTAEAVGAGDHLPGVVNSG